MSLGNPPPQLGDENDTEVTPPFPHDSMVTVRLSGPPEVIVKTEEANSEDRHSEEVATVPSPRTSTIAPHPEESPDSSKTLTIQTSNLEDVPIADATPDSIVDEEAQTEDSEIRRGSESSVSSGEGQVNWEELEKTEEMEPRDQDSEDSTALLLARLEQENNLLVTNPKSGLTRVIDAEPSSTRAQSRPPSMHQLKMMVNGPTPSALRYSLIPAPPMTDLEFYAALVQDYKRTAQRLPTLLSKKIRSGIPPPLRGVVWQSMSGARDRLLEDEFDRLCGESSPYEGIIGKDLGRSFPGVEMFRDPEGDGQRMLGRVLKCFSLYDHKIGYCQGLGFLVGPLLMHMGDKQAFCVLVRLMENYDLRNCFLPDLSGLHVRIFQFRELLKTHLPKLSAHLDVLQIEPAYVSQWFLSFFAVTCPLPMLFRIYDVIFAEGASETIMRVALAVMRKNEEKIMACTEFEDVMQLLLSRGLWDCYHYNADDFVNDFVSLTGIVTHEILQALEVRHKESRTSDACVSPSPDVGSAASRFLGRLWSGSNQAAKSSTLSPSLAAPSRPVSFLRRSTSKQSIASTLSSMEGVTDSILSSTSTDSTTVSRDSSNTDISSVRAPSNNFSNIMVSAPKSSLNSQSTLHGQIEDLLMALSELQRDHAVLVTQLQSEREEREEDHNVIRALLDGLRKRSSSETLKTSESDGSQETVTPDETATDETDDDDSEKVTRESDAPIVSQEDLSQLLDTVEERVSKTKPDNRRSSMMQSKSQLREDLARSKEQLTVELSKSQDLSRRLGDSGQEIANLKEQVRESHNHIRNAHQEKQRLEKQVYELRAKRTPTTSPDGPAMTETEWPKRASTHGGLRELRLGRSNSNRVGAPAFNKRVSSLITQTITGKENEPVSPQDPASTPPAVDNDALILELVQAKTAEAVAKQEAEEAKAKLESLRRLLAGGGGGAAAGNGPGHRSSPSQPSIERSATMGGYLAAGNRASDIKGTTPAAAAGGGFWGGWGKRTVSVGVEKVT